MLLCPSQEWHRCRRGGQHRGPVVSLLEQKIGCCSESDIFCSANTRKGVPRALPLLTHGGASVRAQSAHTFRTRECARAHTRKHVWCAAGCVAAPWSNIPGTPGHRDTLHPHPHKRKLRPMSLGAGARGGRVHARAYARAP